MEELRYELLKVIYQKKIEIIDSLIDCQKMPNCLDTMQKESEYALRCLSQLEHSIMTTKLPKA